MRATHPQRTKFPSVGPSGSYGFTVELAAGSAPPAKASCHGLAPVKNYTSSSREPPGMTPGPRESILAVWRAPRGSGERTEDPETRSSTRWTTELLGLTHLQHLARSRRSWSRSTQSKTPGALLTRAACGACCMCAENVLTALSIPFATGAPRSISSGQRATRSSPKRGATSCQARVQRRSRRVRCAREVPHA